MLNESKKSQIQSLRNKGLGYKQIAARLDLTRDEVRNYCNSTMNDVTRNAVLICDYCGTKLEQPAVGRKKRFCNKECRNRWWAMHRDHGKLYSFTCECCGKEFTTCGISDRKYCSRQCYYIARFGKYKPPVPVIDVGETEPKIVFK